MDPVNNKKIENKNHGGLNELEIKILELIEQNNEKLNRYRLSKSMGIDKKKIYRVVKKLVNFHYVDLTKDNKLVMSSLGNLFYKWIVSKNANKDYKYEKTKKDMELDCTKCGETIEHCGVTCINCTLKEIEEDPECHCDFCKNELLEISAAEEIILFYKDSDKDFNFCSKECLTKFVEKL